MPSLIPHSTCNILPEETSSAFFMCLMCVLSVLNYFLDLKIYDWRGFNFMCNYA